MKKIRHLLLILVTGSILLSCVPLNQFKEIEEKTQSCSSERDQLIYANEGLIVDTTEMGAELRRYEKDYTRLVTDTLLLGKEFRHLKKLYEGAVSLNRDLTDSKEALARGSAAEAKKLLSELQSAQEDLQRKEDALRALEKVLDKKKASLDKLQSELEENNAILAQQNAELEERNKQLIKLQSMLNAKDSIVNALKDKVAEALGQFEEDGLTVELKNGKVYVSLDEKLLFKSGKWNVDPKGKSAIQKLAKVLEQNPDINIQIEGHTDDVPYNGRSQVKDNWDLSVKRATSIVRILFDKTTIYPQRLTAAGRGEFVPIDPANTSEARQKNRRTEIILSPKLDELFQLLESN
jgi:chemotaxis protein MotB